MGDIGFRFLGYRVPEVSIEIKDAVFAGQTGKFEINVDVQQNFVQENNRFVEIVLRLKIKSENDIIKMSLTIKGGFEADKEMPDEMFKEFWTYNAPAILFPHARAIVTTFTAQAGIAPVLLPLVSFNPRKEEKEVVEKEAH